MTPLIAITQGDAAGIGPEIIVKACLSRPDILQGCFVAGDVATLRRAASLFVATGQPALPIAVISSPQALVQVPPRCLAVLQIGAPPPLAAWGKVDATAGEFAGRCIGWAAQAALDGRIHALVTAPIHKEALAAAGLPYSQFPGHTEMLQSAAAQHLGLSTAQLPVRMMLANDELRTVLVSVHVSLRQAIEAITIDNVLETIRITHQALVPLLQRAPRIAVAGLNPHAGEGGLFGHEEIDVIIPAIQAAQACGYNANGPFAPDTVFMRARQCATHPAEFDVVIAMYHDQGLIPVKYLGVEKGVNVTLGLPLVRTSPDHGTAFDIAGTGMADASSLLEAIAMAKTQLNTPTTA
jgi:4-hydroxythreonine-4-phosphate dehydrogenase